MNDDTPMIEVENPDPTAYMFWDEVHPSDAMHKALAKEVYAYTKAQYQLVPAKEITQPCCPVSIAKGMLEAFKDKYQQVYQDYKSTIFRASFFFGGGPSQQDFSGIDLEPCKYEPAIESLRQIYALSREDKLVKKALVQMGWLEKDGSIPDCHIPPMLKQAYEPPQKPQSLCDANEYSAESTLAMAY